MGHVAFERCIEPLPRLLNDPVPRVRRTALHAGAIQAIDRQWPWRLSEGSMIQASRFGVMPRLSSSPAAKTHARRRRCSLNASYESARISARWVTQTPGLLPLLRHQVVAGIGKAALHCDS